MTNRLLLLAALVMGGCGDYVEAPDNPECLKEIDGKCIAVRVGPYVELKDIEVRDSHGYGIISDQPQGEGDE